MTPKGLSGDGTLGYPISQPLFNGRIGPYEWSDALYIVACENATDISNMNLVAFKSTDSGQTWTRVDSLANTIPNGAASVFYRGTGSVLDVGFMDDSLGNHGDLHRTTFDMGTETFGSVEDVGITVPNYSGVQFLLRLSSGDFVYAWGEADGGNRNVQFAAKISGTWSVATDVSGATLRSFMFMDMFEDANGDAGLLWYTKTVGNATDQLHYATISGLTVSDTTLAITASTFRDLGTPSMYLAGPDTIVYPIMASPSLADNDALYLMGENISTSPSWSVVTVFSETATIDDFGQFPQIFETLGGFAYFWTDLGPGIDLTDALIFKSTAATLAGPWSAPETYYDCNASPSDPPASSNELYPFYGRVLTDGSIGLIIGEVQHVEGPSFCGVLYYLPPSGPAGCGDPIQVSPDDAQFRPSASEINPYYFSIGTDLYQVLVASQGEAKLGVFKRAKASVSGAWAEQDSASSPDNTAQSGFYNVVKNGTKLAILYLKDDFTSLKIVEFETATDTYGSPTAALTIPTSAGTFCFFLRGSTYTVIGSGGSNTYAATNTGGTWSSITNLFGAPITILYGGVLNVFGKYYFIYNQTSFHLEFASLDASLVYTHLHTLTNNLRDITETNAIVSLTSTSLAVGFISTAPGGIGFGVTLITGLNGTPGYTSTPGVYSQGVTETIGYPTLALGIGGALTAFYTRKDTTTMPVVNEVDRSAYSGTAWSTPAAFYDAVANPPVGGTSDASQVIRALQPVAFGSGWSLALTMNTFDDPDTFQTGFFIDPCGAGTTLQLVKSVVGGTGVPAMWLLSAAGPTPISGAGDTGVLPVDPGDYVLTESVGPDGYVAGSYVCVGGTQVGSTVTIAEGDDVVCTITNMFGTPPFRASCPNPIYVVGTPYSSFVAVVGGVAPYTFAVLSGSLPTGLSLDASTGEISGTPSADGPFTFVIEVTDDNGDHADTASCSAGRCPGTRSII